MSTARKVLKPDTRQLTALDSGATQKAALLNQRITGVHYDTRGGMWLELDNRTAVRFSVFRFDSEFELALELAR
ncbi:MAG TPA: hypothetical protein VIW64_12645 [Pyrinomonadaceae bacterium]|jgi:hypothetical protein